MTRGPGQFINPNHFGRLNFFEKDGTILCRNSGWRKVNRKFSLYQLKFKNYRGFPEITVFWVRMQPLIIFSLSEGICAVIAPTFFLIASVCATTAGYSALIASIFFLIASICATTAGYSALIASIFFLTAVVFKRLFSKHWVSGCSGFKTAKPALPVDYPAEKVKGAKIEKPGAHPGLCFPILYPLSFYHGILKKVCRFCVGKSRCLETNKKL